MFSRSSTLVSASVIAVLLTIGGGAAALYGANQGDAAIAQCSDTFDNDSDGRTDYPADPDCSSVDDNDEYTGASGVYVSITDGRDRVSPGAGLIYAVTLATNDSFSQTTNLDVAVPAELGIIGASNGGTVAGSLVRWSNVTVSRTNPLTYTIQGTVSPRAPQGITLVARATAGGYQAADTTLVRSTGVLSSTDPAFDIDITDGETSVLPDEVLDYVVNVKNTLDFYMTSDVRVSLSPFLVFVEPEGTTDHNSSRILWSQQSFAPGQERTYRFTAQSIDRAARQQVIRVSASAGNSVGTDSTTIRSMITPHNMDISITDGLTQAAVNDLITYSVTIENNEDGTVTDAYVSAALPIYAEFVAAQDGGVRQGSNIRWNRLEIAGNGTRTVGFTVRVRDDAPLGTDLLASASVDGRIDYDRTTVGVKSASRNSSTTSRSRVVRQSPTYVAPVPTSSATPRSTVSSSYRPTAVASSVPLASKNVLLQKTADRKQVLAGSTVRFRVIVNNITGNVLSGLSLDDKFDPSQFTVVEPGSATAGQGTLQWSIPTLQPGDTWSATYVLKASADLAGGTQITNLAALSGTGLDSVALDRRLSATKVSVVTSLPSTGAPMDAISLVVLSALPVLPLSLQKKLRRA